MENLGKLAKDKITGFEGVVTSKHIYLTGCNQYGVQPKVNKEGKIPEREYFDEFRLEFLEQHVTKEDVTGDVNGCDFREHPNK